jgi:osmotically inducible protein OsmC
MTVRTADAEWHGALTGGEGAMRLGSGAFTGSYSFRSRFENGQGTNPEELLAAAEAGCFSMALVARLERAGFAPKRVHTTARAHIDKSSDGFRITRIELETEAEVPGMDETKFQDQADATKRDCPVSRALAGVDIILNAQLANR